MTADGTSLLLDVPEAPPGGFPDWSPTDSHIAFTGNAEIMTMRPDGSQLVNLTNNPAQDRYASWSP